MRRNYAYCVIKIYTVCRIICKHSHKVRLSVTHQSIQNFNRKDGNFDCGLKYDGHILRELFLHVKEGLLIAN